LKTSSNIAAFSCVFALGLGALFSAAQTTAIDPLEQKLGSFSLKAETATDGIAKLSQVTSIAYSIEFPLGRSISQPAPELKRLNITMGPSTVRQVLDSLCSSDPTFQWRKVGDTVNLFPRSLEHDDGYIMNRRIPELILRNVPDAEKAVFSTVAQIPGKKEQIALFQSGLSVGFAKPWSVERRDISVREAMNLIARQLGSTVGWQFGGGDNFRVLTFHLKLSVREKNVESESQSHE